MKNILTIITLLGILQIFISCTNENNILTKYYGNKYSKSDNLNVYLNINDFKTFEQLRNRIEKIVCHDSLPVIKLINHNSIKHIQLSNSCWENILCSLIKERNVLRIVDERIFKDKVYGLNNLSDILYKHLCNSDNSPYYSEHKSKAFISISYVEKSIDSLPWLLERITEEYEKIQNGEDLIIVLEKLPPPPPPLPVEIGGKIN